MTDVLFDTEEQRKPPTKNKCCQIMAIALKFMQSGVRWEKKYIYLDWLWSRVKSKEDGYRLYRQLIMSFCAQYAYIRRGVAY